MSTMSSTPSQPFVPELITRLESLGELLRASESISGLDDALNTKKLRILTEQLNTIGILEEKPKQEPVATVTSDKWPPRWFLRHAHSYVWLAGVLFLSLAAGLLVGWPYCYGMAGIGLLLLIPKLCNVVACLVVAGSGGMSLWSINQQFSSVSQMEWLPAILVGLTVIGIVVITLAAMNLLIKMQQD